MSKEKALDRYFGRNGQERMNCAQAVASGPRDRGIITEEEFAGFAACGRGRAPQGHCGCVFAAVSVLEKIKSEDVDRFKEMFSSQAASLKCEEIRAAKKMKCPQCVEAAADFIERTHPST